MAKPTFVGGTSGSGTGASFTVSLNGTLTGGSNSSPQAGDLILVFIGQSNTGTVTSTCSGNTSGAYPTIRAHQVAADTYDANLDSVYQFAGATPDTTLTIGRTNDTTYGCAAVVHVWRGVHTTTPFNVTPTIASGTNGSAANPAAITPTVADSIVVYCGVGTQTSTGTAFTAAGTYPVTAKGDGSTSDVDVMVSSYTAWTSGAYDPAAFTGSTTTTACAWVAVTLTLQPAAVVNHPLTCNSGSYSYSGSSAPLVRGRALSASPGSYAYSGSSATLTVGAALNHRSLTASPGSYTYTGSTATLVKGKRLIASAGSYSYAGSTATLLRSKSLTASPGAYTYTGSNATLAKGKTIGALAGSYAYSGQTATVLRSRSLTCSAGSYSLTGQSAVLRKNRALVASAGSYAYTGSAATIVKGKRLVANAGSYSYTGSAATLVKGRRLTANAGSYTYTGNTATLVRGRVLTTVAGSYSYIGSSADITKSAGLNHRALTALAGNYAYAGQSATLVKGRALSAQAGSYTYSGSSATLSIAAAGYSLTALPGAYALTGQTAVLRKSYALLLTPGSYSYIGSSIGIIYGGETRPSGAITVMSEYGTLTAFAADPALAVMMRDKAVEVNPQPAPVFVTSVDKTITTGA